MRRASSLIGAAVIAACVCLPAAVAGAAEPDPGPTSSPADVSVSVVIPAPSAEPGPPTERPPTTPPVTAPGGGVGGDPGGGPPASPPGPPVVTPGPAADAAPGRIDDEYVEPGEEIVFGADGYTPGEKVQVVVYSTPLVLGSVTADANGSMTARVSLEPDFPAGIHTLEATGWDSGAVASIQFVVVGPGAAAASADAPSQRSVVLAIVAIALAFALVALVVSRRLRLPFLPERIAA